MTIFGVALLAACTLLGAFLGDLLGALLHVKANVGGVGIAMLLLLTVRLWLTRRRALGPGVVLGIEFWGALYIPIVVAMASTQNVLSAWDSGPLVAIAAVLTVALCFLAVGLFSRVLGKVETMDEIEARERQPLSVTLGEVD